LRKIRRFAQDDLAAANELRHSHTAAIMTAMAYGGNLDKTQETRNLA
jgi:hypothetical protein